MTLTPFCGKLLSHWPYCRWAPPKPLLLLAWYRVVFLSSEQQLQMLPERLVTSFLPLHPGCHKLLPACLPKTLPLFPRPLHVHGAPLPVPLSTSPSACHSLTGNAHLFLLLGYVVPALCVSLMTLWS